jgi:hypothetical protein
LTIWRNLINDTSVLYIASAGHKSIVRLLLDQGAHVNAKDKYGQISIMMIPQQQLDQASGPITQENYQAIIAMVQYTMEP